MQRKFYVGCKNQIMQQFKNIKKIHASKWQALPPASLQLLAEKCAMISVAQSTTEKPIMGKRLWMLKKSKTPGCFLMLKLCERFSQHIRTFGKNKRKQERI